MVGDLEGTAHGQFARVEVHVGPLEPQQLALTQAGVQGDDVQRLVTRAPRGVEQDAYLDGGERLNAVRPSLAAATGPLAFRDIAVDQVVAHGLRESLLQGDVDVVDGSRGERLALLVVEPPDFGAREILELAGTERRLEMVVRDALVADEGAVRHLAGVDERLEAIAEPRIEPLGHLEVVGVEEDPLICVGTRLV
nr:hypothetical protein [Rubrobacter tropicus]